MGDVIDEIGEEVVKEAEAPVAPLPTDKIPGLDLTWEVADELELGSEAIKILQDLKRSHPAVELHVVSSDRGIYVVRSCSRAEWRKFLNEASGWAQSAERVSETDSPQIAQNNLRMLVEEKTVERFTVYPKVGLEQIRLMAAGEVMLIHDAIMMASGHGRQAIPVKI